jgi:PTH2 family peptidyl-tRNA hydrolase
MSKEQPKQVIVVRKDLNMRKGKIAAQAAHASLKAIMDIGKPSMKNGKLIFTFDPDSAVADWLMGESFAKICVYVESEKDLDLIFENAKLIGLPATLIVDSGRTEFNGVPTKTCVAIGPDIPAKIDTVTGHLPLL